MKQAVSTRLSARVIVLAAIHVAVLAGACSAYDPELLNMRDVGVAGSGGSDAGDDDAGAAECRVVPDSNCAIVCLERCNNMDDDCDGVVDNNSAASSCDIANGEAACDQGTCRLVRCVGDYADCNGIESDGCEVLLPSDPNNCGLCQAECSFLNATALCIQDQCVRGDCLPSFGDCDGQPSNGCETSLTTLAACGSCAGRCVAGPNALPTCDTGVCAIAECVGNYEDCDEDVATGCEQSLDDPGNCGGCGVDCGTLPNATGTCGETGCEGIVCTGAFQDCNGLAEDGCEALFSDPANCGACGVACDLPNVAAHLCDTSGGAATCGIDDTAANGGCDAGFADCNDTDADGCERPLNTVTDCGTCGTACTKPNATARCDAGACAYTCGQGFADCDPSDDASGITCTSLAADQANCGVCGVTCADPLPACSGGGCRSMGCPMGSADCANNEMCVQLNTATDCGTCGAACAASLPNATGSCATGTCQIVCNTGFADCDSYQANGCETDLNATGNCGTCGNACSRPNATSVCTSGSCGLGTCAMGFGNCDTMDGNGCEAALTTPTNCGTCANDCTGKPNTTGAGCDNGACSFSCASGYRDCDTVASNGCEVNINTPANCGSCGNNCAALANVAMAACTTNGCDITACAAGFSDCDGLPSNGCERSTTTLTDCGTCNTACAFANAAETCPSGNCTMGACSSGFGNCDMMTSNGCETQLNTLTNCGACGTACATDQVCNNGVCASAACPSGQSYCGGTTCVRIDGNCAPWPCALRRPGPYANCGGCGKTCALYGGECCLGI